MRNLPAFDARYFQVLFQAFFLSYGITFLHWNADWPHYAACIGGCLLINYLFESVKRKEWLPVFSSTGWQSWGLSVLISAMSLCLLLKTSHWYITLIAVLFTVASKYFLKIDGKHIFNPSAFGIVGVLLVSDNNAWLSPGQWGSDAVIFFTVITLGTVVVTRVQKLDVSLAFLITFIGLLYWRQVLVLGWPFDHFLHAVTTGSLLLFSFFMISDPKTSPDHPIARIIWAVLIACIAFYLAAFKWRYNTLIWVLVAVAPLLPVMNRLFKAVPFHWHQHASVKLIAHLKNSNMKLPVKKIAAFILLIVMISHEAVAFCGFYVSKADGTLKNKTSQVIMVRDGNYNVITMFNDFKGNFKDFAMVVPVPVVLKKSDIRVIDQQIFQRLNDYSKPRLVEYYDSNPCIEYKSELLEFRASALNEVVVAGYGTKRKRDLGVKVEAKYLVGEYDILILSAKESAGLKTWLVENGYKIPSAAEEVLQPYIKSNLKFFVVKVNEKQLKKIPGNFLRPIQIAFHSPKFMLPIRLGMANADGDQDMIVYAFTREGRVEATNYRTVELPTAKKIPLFVKDNFSVFYANLFQHQWKREGKSVALLEYAWDVTPQSVSIKCDPCVATAPSASDLVQAGVSWANVDQDQSEDIYGTRGASVHFTRLHIRYNRESFPQDLQFQVTPNKAAYQARYIITHPATGDMDCEEGAKYIKHLKQRRQQELNMLTSLTGKQLYDWDLAINEKTDEAAIPEVSYEHLANNKTATTETDVLLIATIGMLGLISAIGFSFRV